MNFKVNQTSFESRTYRCLFGLHFMDYYEFNKKIRFCYRYLSRLKRYFTLYLLILRKFNYSFSQSNKINGVSFIGPPQEIDSTEISLPKRIINSSYLSLMPYGFIPESSTELKYNCKWQWWGEKTKGAATMMQLAKKQGYEIMLKPHVRKRHGAFTGHHSYSREGDWKAFEISYSKYIFEFAALAEKEEVALFYIWPEWEEFVKQRPDYWSNLIKEIKKVDKRKLTYAANWDEYKRVPF